MSSSSDQASVGFYGYTPALAPGVVFLTLFSLLTAASVGQAIYTCSIRRQLWWTSFVIIGGLCEMLGWAGRIAAHINPQGLNQFLMQQVLLILGPCFYSAVLYGILGAIMLAVAPEKPLVKPRYLAPFFICADIISIVVQAAGGGQAGGSAGRGEVPSSSATWTMAAGIIFQLVVMLFFVATALYLYWSTRTSPLWREMKLLALGNLFAAFMIILRGFFRSAELGEGWTGHLYTHEGFLIGLDAVPMVLCMLALVIAHPTWSLPRREELRRKDSEATVVGSVLEKKETV